MKSIVPALASLAVAIAPSSALAQVTTAAWVYAGTYCEAREAGVDHKEALRLATYDNGPTWAEQYKDPTFARLASHQIGKRCPQFLGR